jgi:hypothetical protein
MLGMLTDHAVISMESIPNQAEKEKVEMELTNPKFNNHPKKLIDISLNEVNEMCGNVLQVMNDKGEECVVMSSRAYNGFSEKNRRALESRYHLLHSDLTTIENIGGGSARCLLAELY